MTQKQKDKIIARTQKYLEDNLSYSYGPWHKQETSTPNTVSYLTNDRNKSFTFYIHFGTKHVEFSAYFVVYQSRKDNTAWVEYESRKCSSIGEALRDIESEYESELKEVEKEYLRLLNVFDN